MAWTFDDRFPPERIEQLLPMLTDDYGPGAPTGGFVDGAIVLFHISADDGGDHYLMRQMGNMRLLTAIGLLDVAKADVIRSYNVD